MAASAASTGYAQRLLPDPGRSPRRFVAMQTAGLVLLGAAFAIELAGRWAVVPSETSYGAMTYLFSFLNGQLIAALAIFGMFNIVAVIRGRIYRAKRVGQQGLTLLWSYLAVQAIVSYAILGGWAGVTL